MTKTQFKKNLKKIIKELEPCIENECMRLYCSGAVDTEAFENSYQLPKYILHVALLNEAEQYRPLERSNIIANLKRF